MAREIPAHPPTPRPRPPLRDQLGAGAVARLVAYDLLREFAVQRLAVDTLDHTTPHDGRHTRAVIAKIRASDPDSDVEVDLALAAQVLAATSAAARDEHVQAAFGPVAAAVVDATDPAEPQEGISLAMQHLFDNATTNTPAPPSRNARRAQEPERDIHHAEE